MAIMQQSPKKVAETEVNNDLRKMGPDGEETTDRKGSKSMNSNEKIYQKEGKQSSSERDLTLPTVENKEEIAAKFDNSKGESTLESKN